MRGAFGSGRACAIARVAAFVGLCVFFAGGAAAYTFTSAEGNFTVEFPGMPTLEQTNSKTGTGTPFVQSTWSVETSDSFFAVAVIVYARKVLKDYDASIQGSVSAAQGTLARQTTIKQAGVTGREIVIDAPDNFVLRLRYLWIGEQLYMLNYTGRRGTETAPAVNGFMNSFQLRR